mmetsp:Transcript_36052/g.103689  ORF Transcript_36052/g.103689 Transcript_36052/m.103689 type:complete len:147 (+) Transcript_36052:254-694(+)
MVSQQTLIYSYVFTFAALLAIMTNACQYFYLHQPPKRDGAGSQLAPCLLLAASTVLMLLSPIKNLVVNVCMASFRQTGYDATIGHVLDIAYMPCFGTVPMQAYTTLGYALMAVATGMQVDIAGKFHASMAQVRRNAVKKATCPPSA